MPTVRANFQEANDFVHSKIYALEADTVRSLYDAYLAAYKEMATALDNSWSAAQISGNWDTTHIQTREALLAQISEIMNRLDMRSTRMLYDSINDAIRAGHYGASYSLDASVGQATMQPSFMPLLPVEAVAAQALAPYLGQTWLERYRDNRAEFELRIKRSLVQSQIQGESMQQAQMRIREELGITPGRQLKADRQSHRRNFNRVRMIARSEIMRASNNASVAVYEANSDVLKGWEYIATRDERTCPRCGPLDGRQFSWMNEPIDGEGGTTETLPPPIHPMCRCATLPVLIDQDLERRIVGKRVTFTQWAQARGVTQSQHGKAYMFRGKSAPKVKGA